MHPYLFINYMPSCSNWYIYSYSNIDLVWLIIYDDVIYYIIKVCLSWPGVLDTTLYIVCW